MQLSKFNFRRQLFGFEPTSIKGSKVFNMNCINISSTSRRIRSLVLGTYRFFNEQQVWLISCILSGNMLAASTSDHRDVTYAIFLRQRRCRD